MRRNERRGLSLTELIASLSIFILFSLVLTVCLIAGLRFAERAGSRSDIQQTLMRAESLMTADFRQAIQFAAKESIVHLWGNKKVTLFLPGPADPGTHELYFTIPHFSHFPTDAISLTFESPACFQTIHYVIRNGTSIIRESIVYDESGNAVLAGSRAIIMARENKLQLDAEYVSSSCIRLTLSESSPHDSFKISFKAYSENNWAP
jgi:hypothetical protein